MKRISRIVAALLVPAVPLLAGCHADPPATHSSPAPTRAGVRSAAADSARLRETKDSLAVLAGAPDTFRASNRQVFRMQLISKARYAAASASGPEHALPADSAAAVATEKAFMQPEAGRVWRVADTLFFRAGNGRVSWLHDGPTYQNADDSYEQYRYLDNLAAIQQWLVEVGQWEGRHYLLVDQQTGKKTKLISYPVVSPDYTQFACANSDPTGYSLDGLQLWRKPAGKPPRLRWQRLSNVLQPGLAANGLAWEGNHSLLFYEDFTVAGRYVQVKLH